MKEEDFPGLFLAADKVAKNYQDKFKLVLKTNLITLVIAAILSFIPISHWIIPLLQLLVLLTTLLCSIYLATQKPEKFGILAELLLNQLRH